MSQRGLAEARWPEDEHVIQRLGPLACGVDEDRQLCLDGLLPDVVGERARPDRPIDGVIACTRDRIEHPLFAEGAHVRAAPCSARRIISSVVSVAPSVSTAFSSLVASCGL